MVFFVACAINARINPIGFLDVTETLAAAERAHASLLLSKRRGRRRSQTCWLALPV
jgi:hypothetical protein